MRIGMLVVAAAVAVTLAGCEKLKQAFGIKDPGTPIHTARPNPHLCKQDGVKCETIMVNPGAEVWVKDPIVMFGKRRQELEFKLVAGYEFDQEKGIEVADPDRKYTCEKDANDRGKYLCVFTHRRDDFGLHKYTIRVKRTSGAALPPYDPYFINE